MMNGRVRSGAMGSSACSMMNPRLTERLQSSLLGASRVPPSSSNDRSHATRHLDWTTCGQLKGDTARRSPGPSRNTAATRASNNKARAPNEEPRMFAERATTAQGYRTMRADAGITIGH
jgi:hypothetical protein